MKFESIKRAYFKDGDRKILTITFKDADGAEASLDMEADVAKGLAMWLVHSSEELASKDLRELEECKGFVCRIPTNTL